MKIETATITVNGKTKIVNADDPRVKAKPAPARASAPSTKKASK